MTDQAAARPAGAPAAVGLVGYLCAVLTPLFWAGNFIVARLLRDDIPPFQMSFWRWLGAALILLPFAWPQLRAQGAAIRRESPMLLVLSALGVLGFTSLLYLALQRTTVVNAALINSLMPAVTFLFAWVLLGERMGGRKLLGLLVSFAGVATIILNGDPGALARLQLNGGDLLVVAALSCWAGYTVLIKWRPTRLPITVFLVVIFALGSALHLPFLLWEWARGQWMAADAGSLAGLLYLALFASVLAYVFWSRAVATLGPGRTGMTMHLLPVFSTLLAVALLGEPFRAYHAAGFALTFTGIMLIMRAKPRR